MKYIDIHCHLDSTDYDSDREKVLARMNSYNISAIIIGTDLESSKRAVQIAEDNKNIWACIGIHPDEVSRTAFDTSKFEELIKNPKVIGIGECGVDFLRIDPADLKDEKKKQTELFESQIQFALEYNQPLMLHIRSKRGNQEAYIYALNILGNYKNDNNGKKLRGNVHFFAGDVSIAEKFLDLGFTMSFTGVVTFTHDYDEVIKYLPRNSIMSETDAPFIAPVPYRGKRNEPTYVIEIIKKLAEIRAENKDVLNEAILENFRCVFGQ